MTTVVLTNASVSPWTPPTDCPPGVVVQIEAWGAGSGASGGSTSFRAGGAGGGWAQSSYKIVAADVTSGIAFSISNGSAGTAAANPLAGADTRFGTAAKNLIPNNTNYGAVVGGAVPTTWQVVTPNGLTVSIAGMGYDNVNGVPYIDVSYVGTTNATAQTDITFTNNNNSLQAVPVSASLSYTFSAYMSATNTTGLTAMASNVNWNTAAGAFISNPNIFTTTIGAYTRYTGTVTSPATAASAYLIYRISYNTGAAINLTLRYAGIQFEQSASATTAQLTPTSYVLAKGGGAASGTTGGVASRNEFNVGFKMFAGGGGATRTQGGGGGGSAGAAGAGAASTTATGGTADAGSGGTAGVSNVEGGGGGTASASGAAGGAPGGGAGANTSTGSGGTGGRGQVRLTYTPTSYGPATKPWRQRHMLIR